MKEKNPGLLKLLETGAPIDPERVGQVLGYRLKVGSFQGLRLSVIDVYPQDYEWLTPEASVIARNQRYRKGLIVKDGSEAVAGIFGIREQELLLYNFEPPVGKIFFLRPGQPHHLEVKNDSHGVLEGNVTPQFKINDSEYLSLIKIEMRDQRRIDYLFSVNPLGRVVNS